MLGSVRITVLDEADQMTDMGFLPQITKVIEQVRPDGQRLLFSATLDSNIDRLVQRFLTDPVVHSVDPSAGAVTTMDHHVLHVLDETDKKAVVTRIAARDGRVILFLDTKRSADRLAKRLLAVGVRAAALHGGRSQPQRNRTLEQFKNGQVTALVATNVAARGIHIDDLDLVVNVDPPTDHKDYVHRGGRTARAGGTGSVVTLVLPDQKRDVTRLMSHAGIRPRTARITSSDAELATITGAREPSGVPVTIEIPQPATPPVSRSDRRTDTEPGKRSNRRRRNGGKATATAGNASETGSRGSARRAADGSAATGGNSSSGGRGTARRAGTGRTTGSTAGTGGRSADRRATAGAAAGAASGKVVRRPSRRGAAGGATGGAAGTSGRGSDHRGADATLPKGHPVMGCRPISSCSGAPSVGGAFPTGVAVPTWALSRMRVGRGSFGWAGTGRWCFAEQRPAVPGRGVGRPRGRGPCGGVHRAAFDSTGLLAALLRTRCASCGPGLCPGPRFWGRQDWRTGRARRGLLARIEEPELRVAVASPSWRPGGRRGRCRRRRPRSGSWLRS